MTNNEIHDLINGNTIARNLANSGRDRDCAIWVSRFVTEVIDYYATEVDVFKLYVNQNNANNVLENLETAAQSNNLLKRRLKWFAAGSVGLNIGNSGVRSMFDTLANSGIISSGDAQKIKSLAEVNVNITTDQVSAAWARYRINGRI